MKILGIMLAMYVTKFLTRINAHFEECFEEILMNRRKYVFLQQLMQCTVQPQF